MKEPHYPYAYDENSLVLHINSAHKGGRYTCINCQEKMVAKTEGERIKYFRHYNNAPSCTGETYLHKLSKILFHRDYQVALKEERPFYIYVNSIATCRSVQTDCGVLKCQYEKLIPHDLTQSFNQISCPHKEVVLDQYDYQIRPDLLLSSSNNPERLLLIEFAVTHRCEDKKISTGAKIVEFQIQDVFKIESLWSEGIKSCDQVTYYNFILSKFEAKQCLIEKCPTRVKKITVNKQSDLSITDIQISAFPEQTEASQFISTLYNNVLPSKTELANLYRKYLSKGYIEVRCYCCEHSQINSSYKKIVCTLKKQAVFPIEATRCIEYKEIQT